MDPLCEFSSLAALKKTRARIPEKTLNKNRRAEVVAKASKNYERQCMQRND